MKKIFFAARVIAVGLIAGIAANASATTTLNGAGATFPFPLYSKWSFEYGKTNSDVHINYQSIGSGGGIRQITERTVDFGASDSPMTDEQLDKAPGKLVHIPTTLGAVVIAYNLPGAGELKLTSEVIAGIYLGEITKWNDKRIADLNAGAALPATDIAIVHRSDGSGTTGVFTDYLSKVNAGWKSKVGAGNAVQWPVGIGAKGNEGVSGALKTTPGAVGYIELAFAVQNKMTFATVKNSAGSFVKASTDSVSAAAQTATIPDDYRVSITNPPGAGSYPISSFTYLLVYQDAQDANKGEALAKFLWWAIHDGQKFAAPLSYAALPPALQKKVEATLQSLKADGKPLLSAK